MKRIMVLIAVTAVIYGILLGVYLCREGWLGSSYEVQPTKGSIGDMMVNPKGSIASLVVGSLVGGLK